MVSLLRCELRVGLAHTRGTVLDAGEAAALHLALVAALRDPVAGAFHGPFPIPVFQRVRRRAETVDEDDFAYPVRVDAGIARRYAAAETMRHHGRRGGAEMFDQFHQV